MPRLEILLLVEDDINHAELIQRTIRKVDAGISVVVHRMAETALEYLRSVVNPPNLVLLDMGLPVMSGGDFITAFKTMKRLERVPIIIITGGAMDIAQSFSLGVSDYILKPMSEADFKRVLIKLGYDI